MIKRTIAAVVVGLMLSGGVAAGERIYLFAEGGMTRFDSSEIESDLRKL